MSDKTVKEVLFEAIDQVNSGLAADNQIQKAGDTILIGEGATLDSLALVHFIMSVEQAITDNFQQSVSIANQAVLSDDSGPLHTVDSLVVYVAEQLGGAERDAA